MMMRLEPKPSIAPAFCLVLTLACAGCAPERPSWVPLAEARATAHVYRRPAPEVAAAVRDELTAQGFPLMQTGEGPIIQSHWKQREVLDDKERERYIVLVKRLTDRHTRVEAVRVVMSKQGMETFYPEAQYHGIELGGKKGSMAPPPAGYGQLLASGSRTISRDPSFEWRLIQRVDAAAARRIERDAEVVAASQ